MGCNCGKTKLEGYSKDKFGNKISHAVRNLWEKSKQEQKPVNVTKINTKQYDRLIGYLKMMHSKIDTIDSIDKSFIQKVLSIICEYGKIHPTQFISARSELVWWQLSKSPSQIQSLAQKEYYNLLFYLLN